MVLILVGFHNQCPTDCMRGAAGTAGSMASCWGHKSRSRSTMTGFINSTRPRRVFLLLVIVTEMSACLRRFTRDSHSKQLWKKQLHSQLRGWSSRPIDLHTAILEVIEDEFICKKTIKLQLILLNERHRSYETKLPTRPLWKALKWSKSS